MKDKIYYKYKSLNGNNLSYVLDIILNNRLYCSQYHQLNDPMEGFYKTWENLPDYLRDNIFAQKSNYRICSLANNDTNRLLWAHYAHGFAGIVIGIKTKELVRSVNYNGLSELNDLLIIRDLDISSIFLHKHNVWEYENESRVILNNSKRYIKIEIVEVIFGLRTDSKLKTNLIKLLLQINPNIIFKQQNRNYRNIEIIN